MMERSAEAPPSWQQFHTEDAVRRLVIDLAPDVVCFQELPAVPFVETHDLLPATTRTHSGNLAILVSHELAATDPVLNVVEGAAVLATFEPGDRPPFTVANVHLAAGRGGSDLRVFQVSQIVNASPTAELVIIGDTNMRLGEEEVLTSVGFSADKPPTPTWDSKRNRFRFGAPEFSAYYTRWLASPSLVITDVSVLTDPTEHAGARFHLSDHYALTATLSP